MKATVDARGLACPQPVLLTKKAIGENEEVTVLVDNDIAVENIRRLALNIWDEFFSDFALIRDAVSQDPDFTPGQLQEALTWIKDQYSQRHQNFN